jgi:hypothetical protein
MEKRKIIDMGFHLHGYTCPKQLKNSMVTAGKSAELAEQRKVRHYEQICKQQYTFIPVCIETMGSFGPFARKFITHLGSKLVVATGEAKAAAYLTQSISMAVQKGNSNCVISCFPKQQKMNEIYSL